MATAATLEAGTGTDRLIRVDAPPLGYLPSFDGLRGIIAFQVVAFHSGLLPFEGTPLVVDWFFVASGFLITTLLLDETRKSGDISLRNFYTRRALRLFPAMYAMIMVFSLIMLAVQATSPGADIDGWWIDSLAAGFYVFNFVGAFGLTMGGLGHTWSLAVEEQFYLVWPPIIRHTLRKATRRADLHLIVGMVLFIAIFFFLRVRFHWVTDWSDGTLRMIDDDAVRWEGVVYRLASVRPDMIVYGCLVAMLVRVIPRPAPQWLLRTLAVVAPLCWVVFAAVVVLAGSGLPGMELYGGPWYSLALLGLGPTTLDLYLRRQSWYSKALCWKPFRYLGIRCYGIYLWHMVALLPFIMLMEGTYGVQKLVLAIAGTAWGILVGIGSYRFIERPFLRLKERRYGGNVHSMGLAATEPGAPTPDVQLADGSVVPRAEEPSQAAESTQAVEPNQDVVSADPSGR